MPTAAFVKISLVSKTKNPSTYSDQNSPTLKQKLWYVQSHLIRTSPYYGQSTCISGDRLRIQRQLRDNICSLHRGKFEVWASGMTARYISLKMKFGK